MRKINIANAKNRNATIGFEAKPTRKRVAQRLKDGGEKHSVKILKTTLQTDIKELIKKYDDLENLSNDIIKSDIECDIETTGMMINNTKKIYVDQNNKMVYNVKLIEVIKDKDANEISRKPLVQKTANISIEELPIKWSKKAMPKSLAIKKFVFSKHYQIRHINGLTFDFLYDMAKELHDNNSLMFVGAGAKGNEPLHITTGGSSYRGFLEGRIDGDKYMLILHLTNLELKEFTK